ncbi:ATP-dependent endonuclease [Microbacterium sp. NPDC089696]|jgi:hypothetical protein|uniref:ATP-dependent endonuclease n=1 Tax=Microbacterium sp. NPDC089696 TaxID=3364199 RepID=UPI00382B7DBA
MATTQTVPRTVVLFEGRSDSLAFRSLARRRGVDVRALELTDLDGITNLRTRVSALRSALDVARILGLYDAAEGGYVSRVLVDLGMLEQGASPESIGFFGCERDLEDEVIAAAGPDLVQETLDARGELGRFRVFQGQPAQRDRSIQEQLHRFAGTAAGRKARFSADVIDVLPLDRMPRALSALLDASLSAGGQ